MHDYWNDPPEEPDAPACIREGCDEEPTLTADDVWKCECGATWAYVPEIEPDEPDEPEEEVEPYQRPIEVYCSTCKEWTDESRHKFVDISEGMIGEDRLTFECVKCKQESTSSRVAR